MKPTKPTEAATTPDGLLIHQMPGVGFAVSAAEHNYKLSEWQSALAAEKARADAAEEADEAHKTLLHIKSRELEQLQAAHAAAMDALEDLWDEQNGPPLSTREAEWHAAYQKAYSVIQAQALERGEGKGD